MHIATRTATHKWYGAWKNEMILKPPSAVHCLNCLRTWMEKSSCSSSTRTVDTAGFAIFACLLKKRGSF